MTHWYTHKKLIIQDFHLTFVFQANTFMQKTKSIFCPLNENNQLENNAKRNPFIYTTDKYICSPNIKLDVLNSSTIRMNRWSCNEVTRLGPDSSWRLRGNYRHLWGQLSSRISCSYPTSSCRCDVGARS